MAKTTTATIEKNGKSVALEGIKASYNQETKAYKVKATMKVSVKWYKATKKAAERIVFTGDNKFYSLVCTKMGKKIRFSKKDISSLEKRVDADKLAADMAMYEKGFNELKSYLNKKMNLKDMNWDTLLKKIGAIAEVVEESQEEEPKAEEVAA